MIILIIKLILIALCGLFWRLGGADGFSKGFRRYGCAGLIAVSSVLTKNWMGLASFPLLFGVFCIGYGEGSWLRKLLKSNYLTRFVCGLLYGLASLPILWGNWWLFGFHLCVVSSSVCLAGNQKFHLNEIEEGFIGLITGLCPIIS